MRRLDARQTRALLRQMGLGEYSESDPNTGHYLLYSEAEVFRSFGGASPGASGGAANADYINNTSFNATVFSTNNTSGDNGNVAVLQKNMRRALLLVQNQSTSADLYVNFGNAAGLQTGVLLTAGVGVIFDYVCPNDAIYVYYDAAANQVGLIVEGVRVLS